MLQVLVLIVLMASTIGPILIWLLAIRPYARKHGGGYTPGANIAITAWVDWQHAKDTAKARKDRNILWMCRVFFALSLLTPAIIFSAIVSSAAN